MNIQRTFSRHLLTSLLLAAWAFGLAEESVLLGMVLGAALLLGWVVNDRRLGAIGDGGSAPLALPRWASTTLLVMLTFASALRGYAQREPVSAFMWLLAGILILKVWERREVRDYAQILTVIIFIMIGAALGDTSLMLGVVLLAQLAATVSAVLWYQLRSAQVSGAGRGPSGDERGVQSGLVGRLPASVLVGDLRLVQRTALVASGLIAAGAFVLVPRGIGLQRLGDFGQPLSRTTGFTDVIDLDQSGLISESQLPVMTVRVTDGNGRAVIPPNGRLYMRGAALDEYVDRGWRAAARPNSDTGRRISAVSTEIELMFPGQRGKPPTPEQMLNQYITLRSIRSAEVPVFTMWRPRKLTFPAGGELRINDATLAIVHGRESGVALSGYSVTSWPSAASDVPRNQPEVADEEKSERTAGMGDAGDAGVADGTDRAFSRAENLLRRTQRWRERRASRVTFNSIEIQRVAARVLVAGNLDPLASVRDEADDLRAAELLADYVRSVCRYTLEVPPVPIKSDPIAYFLLESRVGHCELFASALAALCRSVGIDARVIAGYAATEYDVATNTFTVRQADAHAWVEVNTSPWLWVTMDAVPERTADELRAAGVTWFTRIERVLADVRDRWNNSVVMFDAPAQQRLLGGSDISKPWYATLGEQLQLAKLEFEQAPAGNMRALFLRFQGAFTAFAALCLLAIMWCGYRVWVKRGANRRAVNGTAGWAVPPSVKPLASEIDRVFARIGLPRPSYATPREHLAGFTLQHKRGPLSPAGRAALDKAINLLDVLLFAPVAAGKQDLPAWARELSSESRMARVGAKELRAAAK